MALDRTLLAWVRTSASLIGFGFAIYQFFELLNRSPEVVAPRSPHAARLLGLSLVGIGTLALGLALIQYLLLLRYLGGKEYLEAAGLGRMPRFRPAIVVATTLTVVGIITFWVLFVRLPR
jgi:putative membrane protein